MNRHPMFGTVTPAELKLQSPESELRVEKLQAHFDKGSQKHSIDELSHSYTKDIEHRVLNLLDK